MVHKTKENRPLSSMANAGCQSTRRRDRHSISRGIDCLTPYRGHSQTKRIDGVRRLFDEQSIRLDSPRGAFGDAAVHSRKRIQLSLRQPHSYRMFDSGNSRSAFVPFRSTQRSIVNQEAHTYARRVHDAPWTRSAHSFGIHGDC